MFEGAVLRVLNADFVHFASQNGRNRRLKKYYLAACAAK
jgi:hypothetical protein